MDGWLVEWGSTAQRRAVKINNFFLFFRSLALLLLLQLLLSLIDGLIDALGASSC